jgi:hypothetical protein
LTGVLRRRLDKGPLLTAVVYTGVGVLPLYLVSAQVLQLDREVGFGVGRLGLATATFFGAAALAANIGGGIVSKFGAPVGIRLGSATTIVACLLAGTATLWWMIPVATAIGGLGNGIIQVASNIAIFDGVRRRRQGVAFGAKQAAVPMASILAGLSLPAVSLIFGWRWVFGGAGALALGLAISAPRHDRQVEQRRVEQPMGRPSRSMIWLAIAGITGAAAGNGLAIFIVPSAVAIGIAEAAAGAVLAMCSLLVVALRIGVGWLVDIRQSSGHLQMAWLAGFGALGALVLMGASTPRVYLVAMPLALLGAWGWPGIVFFTLVNTYPEFPAKASGLLLSGNLTGTLVGPLVVGAFAGRDDYAGAWLFVSICAAVATIGFVAAGRATKAARLSR